LAGQYSHKQFFRNIGNTYLARYFEHHHIDIDLDLAELTKKDTDSIFVAFSQLNEDMQAKVEADFQNVDALATDGGITALVDESDYHKDPSFSADIAKIEGMHNKAMWAYLERNAYWLGASRFLHADNVSYAYWRKRHIPLNTPPHVDETDITRLESAISEYFYEKEARGKNCKVEVYQRYNKEYFFAYPEDFARSGVEWVENQLSTESRHPAFEIIFVYCEDDGSLDIYAPRNTKAVPALQSLFARAILKINKLEKSKKDDRVYDLNPIKKPSFEFEIEPDCGVEEIIVTQMRVLLSSGEQGRSITVKANATKDSQAVFKLLESLNLPPYFVTQVSMKAILTTPAGERTNSKAITITYPNGCGLSHSGIDLTIRNILAKSGIEPKPAEQGNE
jgi:hypothetical protein